MSLLGQNLIKQFVNSLMLMLESKSLFLTQTFASPSTARLISEFKAAYPNVRQVTYDTVGEDAALDAFEAKYFHVVLQIMTF